MILFCIALLLPYFVYTVDVHDFARIVAEHDRRERELALQTPTQHTKMAKGASCEKKPLSRYSRNQLIQYKTDLEDTKHNEYIRWVDQHSPDIMCCLSLAMGAPVAIGAAGVALLGIEPQWLLACLPCGASATVACSRWYQPDQSGLKQEIKEVDEEIATRDKKEKEQEKEKAE